MCVYHFVDPDLKVEIFFKKEEAAENRVNDYKIGDISSSSHLYWSLKISCRACLLFIVFLVTKR